MTNGDRIRQMRNEELAEAMIHQCDYCTFRHITCVDAHCEEGIKAYLDMEVEE